MKGKVALHFDEFDVEKTIGSQVFRYLHAELNLHAYLLSLRFLNETLPSTSAASLDHGRGELTAKGRVVRGIIQPKTAVQVTSSGISVSFGKPRGRFKVSGAGRLRWKVERAGVLDLALSHLSLSQGEGLSLAEGGRLHAWTRTQDLDLVRPFKSVAAGVTLNDLKIKYPPRLNGLLPLGLVLTGGEGEMSLKLQAESGGGMKAVMPPKILGILPGSFLLRMRNLAGRYFKHEFSGRNFLTLESAAGVFDLDRGQVELGDICLSLSGMDFNFPDSKLWKQSKSWWMHLEIPRMHAAVSPATKQALSARGSLEVLMRDSKPVLEELYRAKIISEFIYKAAVRAPVRFKTHFAKGPKIFELRDGELTLGSGPKLEGEL